MRFMALKNICEGMVLGKTLYTSNGEILLRANTALKSDYIKRISDMQYTGIYIHDEASEGVAIDEIIAETLKIETIRSLKAVYQADAKKMRQVDFNMIVQPLRDNIDKIVDCILSGKNAVLNLINSKAYDDTAYFHCVNTAILSAAIATDMDFNQKEICDIAFTAVLHDIGKKFLPKEIMIKKEKYTEEEKKQLARHPQLGYDYLKEFFILPSLGYVGVLQHHEAYDGSGYPEGRKKDEINKFAKIIAVADAYDNLISIRPDKLPVLPSEAYEFIMGASGTYFDPEVVKCFMHRVAVYPVGTTVLLSNGQKAIVAENYIDFPIRPKLRVLNSSFVNRYLDMKEDIAAINVTIVGVEN